MRSPRSVLVEIRKQADDFGACHLFFVSGSRSPWSSSPAFAGGVDSERLVRAVKALEDQGVHIPSGVPYVDYTRSGPATDGVGMPDLDRIFEFRRESGQVVEVTPGAFDLVRVDEGLCKRSAQSIESLRTEEIAAPCV